MVTSVTKTDGKATLGTLLESMKYELQKVIPQHITADRLARTFLTACQKNNKLLKCTQQSLLKAYMEAGEIGLEPDGINAHLIPYGDQCTYMPDYKGFIKLARLSGEIADMTANVVYSNDEFSHEYGSDKHLKHIKTLKKDRGDRIAAYSYVKYKDGSEDFRVLTEAEVLHAKKSSKSDKIWDGDPDPMWAKTAVRQHAKFLPRHQALQKAAMLDESIEMKLEDVDITAIKTKSKTEKLKKRLESEKEKTSDNEKTEDVVDFALEITRIKGEIEKTYGPSMKDAVFSEELLKMGIKDVSIAAADLEMQKDVTEHFEAFLSQE